MNAVIIMMTDDDGSYDNLYVKPGFVTDFPDSILAQFSPFSYFVSWTLLKKNQRPTIK